MPAAQHAICRGRGAARRMKTFQTSPAVAGRKKAGLRGTGLMTKEEAGATQAPGRLAPPASAVENISRTAAG